VIANKIIPMAGGSAFKNKGVQYLIDAVIDYLPGPLDIAPQTATSGSTSLKTKVEALSLTTTASSCALGFKLWSDKFGRLVFFRVYSGCVKQGRHDLQSPHPQVRARGPS
jgi:elongation factor G